MTGTLDKFLSEKRRFFMRAENKKEHVNGWLRFFKFVLSGGVTLAVMLSLFFMGLVGGHDKWPVAQAAFKGMV